MILINLIPFLIELTWDYLLIKSGKPDVIRLKHRAAMVIGVVLIYAILFADSFRDVDKALIVAVWPYSFFDPLLAWLRKKRGFDYKGKTKNWDKWYNRFNPYFVMTVRILVAVGLIVLFYFL